MAAAPQQPARTAMRRREPPPRDPRSPGRPLPETRGTAISLRFFSLELVPLPVGWGGRGGGAKCGEDDNWSRVCNVSIPTLRTVLIQFYSS